jgi:hypothetical protein
MSVRSRVRPVAAGFMNGALPMIYAIPAGIAVAGAAVLTSWVANRFDSPTPPAWTARAHAREWASLVVLTVWVASLLLAGQAFLLLETGKEPPALFATGAGIAALGGVPALLGLLHPKKSAPRRRA